MWYSQNFYQVSINIRIILVILVKKIRNGKYYHQKEINY